MSSRTKKNKRPHTGGQQQLALDAAIPGPDTPRFQDHSLDFDLTLRNALARAIKHTHGSRAQIAAAMTDLMFGDAGDGEVTKAQLDSWTAPSRDGWRFPASHLPAFIQATGAVWLLDLLARRCGCSIVRDDHAGLIELGELSAAKERIAARENEIRKSLPKSLLKDIMGRAGGGS